MKNRPFHILLGDKQKLYKYQQVGREWCLFESEADEMASSSQLGFKTNFHVEMFAVWCWHSWLFGGSKFDGA